MREPVAEFFLKRGSEADIQMQDVLKADGPVTVTLNVPGQAPRQVRGIVKAGIIDVSDRNEIANQYLVYEVME